MPDLMACEGRYSSPPDWPGPITLGALGRVRYFGPYVGDVVKVGFPRNRGGFLIGVAASQLVAG